MLILVPVFVTFFNKVGIPYPSVYTRGRKMPFSFNGVAHIIMGREASHTCLNVHFSREGIALSVCPIDFSFTIFLFLDNSAHIDK